MRYIWVLLLSMALPGMPALSQDRLITAKDDGSSPPISRYQAIVRSVLHEAYAPDVILRVIDQQSFAPEVAIGLRKSGRGTELFVIRPVKHLWAYGWLDLLKSGRASVFTAGTRNATGAEIARLETELPSDPRNVPLQRCAIGMPDSAVADIQRAWRAMLGDIAPADEQQAGLDGASYYFGMVANGRQIEGTIWSPDKKSRTGKLVQIADTMYDYCRTHRSDKLRRITILSRQIAPAR